MLKNPLVSIIVITYNSSKYVLETLESAKALTYKNIELIVSDDCSTDNTTDICSNWINENKSRFVYTKLISFSKNTGIPSNCNRGIAAAHGEWIKFIAGDDILLSDCIDNVIRISSKNSEIEIMLTQVAVYINNFNENNFRNILLNDWQNQKVLLDTAIFTIQIEYLINGNYFPAPGLFIKKNAINEVGGFDIKYPLIEDVPFLLNYLFTEKKIFFSPVVTVKYRKHSENLTNKKDGILPRYSLQYYDIIYQASRKYGKFKYISNNYWHLWLVKTIFAHNNKGIICLHINKLRLFLQPIRFYHLLGHLRRIQ